MKILGVEKRDIYVNLEFSLNELEQIKKLLDNTEITYDSEEDPDMEKAANFLNNEFYPLIRELLNQIKE